MGLTVYAEKMGFFHKGSNGKGVAPGDVCLSPPPPPAGPVPVPYVNMLSSSDLIKGSTSVKIDGQPTALENASDIAMSTGNEPATPGLGAGVITHKIKGKGAFQLWSFTVKVEGKGVCRHGDMMGQNEASDPLNCIDAAAFNGFLAVLSPTEKGTKCAQPYSEECRPSRKAAQRDAVNGQPCWQCERKSWAPGAPAKKQRTRNEKGNLVQMNYMTHDHQPPLSVAWEMGGCNMQPSPKAFKDHFSTAESVKPHCNGCANSQGSQVGKFAKNFVDDIPTPL